MNKVNVKVSGVLERAGVSDGVAAYFVYGVPATVDARDVLIVPSINRNAHLTP